MCIDLNQSPTRGFGRDLPVAREDSDHGELSVLLPKESKNTERADRNQNSDRNEVDNNLLREELPDANRLLCFANGLSLFPARDRCHSRRRPQRRATMTRRIDRPASP